MVIGAPTGNVKSVAVLVGVRNCVESWHGTIQQPRSIYVRF
jgi:hypothetical protein